MSTKVAELTILERAAQTALAKADAQGGAAAAHWIAEPRHWAVASKSQPGVVRTVTRKKPAAEAEAEQGEPIRRKARGYWWFILECDCPAGRGTDEHAAYAVCWHKAAVFRWWQKYRRVDGSAYRDLPPHSNANSRLNEGDNDTRLDRFTSVVGEQMPSFHPNDDSGDPDIRGRRIDTAMRRSGWVGSHFVVDDSIEAS